MSKVKIAPNKEGKLVTPYEGSPSFGFIVLAQTKSTFKDGWLRETTNRTIMKGGVDALEGFVKGNPTLELDGNLVVNEYLEDAIPEAVASQHFNSDLSFEEQIANYIKRAGKDGPALMSEGKRIIRFVVWDNSGSALDAAIAHDNGAEVKAYNAKTAEASADLPD